jgi:putative Holliday junction resolvase
MKILGIDYGRKKIGLALSGGSLAEPIKVLKIKTIDEGVEKVAKVIQKYDVEKLIVGVSEGKMAEEAKAFGEKVGFLTKKPFVFEDETLSTTDAQALAIEAGIKRKKRKDMEDAYSASIILQSYLDKQ